jgi:hypothetical protein
MISRIFNRESECINRVDEGLPLGVRRGVMDREMWDYASFRFQRLYKVFNIESDRFH